MSGTNTETPAITRTYLVQVETEVIQTTSLLIEAVSADEAEKKATERLKSNIDIEWSKDEPDVGDMVIETITEPADDGAEFVELLYHERSKDGLTDQQLSQLVELKAELDVSDQEMKRFQQSHKIGETSMPVPAPTQTDEVEHDEIIGICQNGCLIKWDEDAWNAVISDESVEDYGLNNMTDKERAAIGR